MMKEFNNDIQYLAEMDIQQWELEHPSKLVGFEMDELILPESCLILLVSPIKPMGDIVKMFNKVLKSISLESHHAMHIFPEQYCQVAQHNLKWVWFAGCDKTETSDTNTLHTPLLSDIEGNNQQRRYLWQQICSYEKSD